MVNPHNPVQGITPEAIALPFTTDFTISDVNTTMTAQGPFDFELYGAIGNGSAPDVNITTMIDRDFTATGTGVQLQVRGRITGAVNGHILHNRFDPDESLEAASGTHPLMATAYFTEPNITAAAATTTAASTVYILDAPTEATNNYALFVDSGDARFDGSVFGSNIDSYQLVDESATTTNPTLIPDRESLNTGIGGNSQANTLSIIVSGVETGRLDANATATETRFMVYDIDNATLERVSVGAADSGGTNFKVLRIPN